MSNDLTRRLAEIGYEAPTPIQEKAIPIILQGSDLLGCAQTGTGKTAAYVLPILDILEAHRSRALMPRCLILLPTRELALQVEESFKDYGAYAGLKVVLLIGGVSMPKQEQALTKGVDVIVATPGRFLDLYSRGKILLPDVRLLVIDEADRMLDMGFIPDVQQIVGLLPTDRQTIFLSATMPTEVKKLASALLNNPKEVKISPPHTTGESIEQFLVYVPHGKRDKDVQKRHVLRLLLEKKKIENAIVFCNTKRDVDALLRSFTRHGQQVKGLHGDMTQTARGEALDQFKSGEIKFLIASDIAARGVDVEDLPNVINYAVPQTAEDYIHRIGRTGRAGRTGHAWTLVGPDDGRLLEMIEHKIKKTLPYLEGFSKTDEHQAPVSPKAESRRTPRKIDAKASKTEPKEPLKGADARKGKKEASSPQSPLESSSRPPASQRQGAPKRPPRPSPREERIVGFGSDIPSFLR